MNITIIDEKVVGPVKIILKKYENLTGMFRGLSEYRIFVNALKSNNPLAFHGPYVSESGAKGQMTRISKDPRWNR
jgi:hypothetical protein